MDERLTRAEMDDRIIRQAVTEAETATRHVVELTDRVIALTAENARLRAQLEILSGGSG